MRVLQLAVILTFNAGQMFKRFIGYVVKLQSDAEKVRNISLSVCHVDDGGVFTNYIIYLALISICQDRNDIKLDVRQ